MPTTWIVARCIALPIKAWLLYHSKRSNTCKPCIVCRAHETVIVNLTIHQCWHASWLRLPLAFKINEEAPGTQHRAVTIQHLMSRGLTSLVTNGTHAREQNHLMPIQFGALPMTAKQNTSDSAPCWHFLSRTTLWWKVWSNTSKIVPRTSPRLSHQIRTTNRSNSIVPPWLNK